MSRIGFSLFGHNTDKAYDLILKVASAGPFDGGCVTVAMALQRKFGGEICVLERANGLADHAVVKVGSSFYDFDGRAETEKEIIARFNENENAETIRARPITEGDLTDAVRDVAAAVKISRLVADGPAEWKSVSTTPAAFSPQEIVEDDGETKNAKVAFFDNDGEAHVRYALGNDGNIHVLGLLAAGNVHGVQMLVWLREHYGKNLVAEEVAPDAGGFWNKMEDRGIVLGWHTEAFKGDGLVISEPVRLSAPGYPSSGDKKHAGWMKAPNGKPTKLSEQQWELVRTPAFKKWFGDWEHDPASASKVVDENGEPMVMYHGTRCEFSAFKRNRKRPGIFFHSDPDSAGQYSNGKGEKRIIPVFLRAVNPWDFQIKSHLAPAVKALPGEKEFSSWMKRELRIGDWEMIEKKSVQAVIAAGDHDSFFVNDRPGKALAVYSPKQIMILGDGRRASVDHSLDRNAKEDLLLDPCPAPQTSNFSPEALLRGFTAHPSLGFKEAIARCQQGPGDLPEEKIKRAPVPGMSA